MATYADVVQDEYGRPIPGVSVYVYNVDGSLASLLSSPNPLTTDILGRFTINVADPGGVYSLEYRFASTIQRVDSIIIGTPPEFKGDDGNTGPANSTYTTLALLKAAAVTNRSYIFAPPAGSDGTATAGTFLYQTAEAPYTADDVNVVKLDTVPLSTGALVRQGAASLTTKPPRIPAAVARPLDEKNGETKSFADFSSELLDLLDFDATYAVVEKAWASAITYGHHLHHPGGILALKDLSFPWRQPVVGPELLDCKGVTIFGVGRESVFKTVSDAGADVMALNGVSNIGLRDFSVTAELLGTLGSGSNGISVTGGFDNIFIQNIWFDRLPRVDKITYQDGGKGLTLQIDSAVLPCGTLKASGITAVSCAQGFGLEMAPDQAVSERLAIDVDLVAQDCYVAVTIGGAPSAESVPAGSHSGVKVRAQSVNCQKNVQLTRAHGVDVGCQIITTASAEDRRLSPDGSTWTVADLRVEGLVCTYAKDSRIQISGSVGDDADHKVRLGGASAGLIGETGASARCNIAVDIGGSAIVPILVEDSGGNTLVDSTLTVSNVTGTIPSPFYLSSNNNLLVTGTSQRVRDMAMAGTLSIVGTDGKTALSTLSVADGYLKVQNFADSAAGALIMGGHRPGGSQPRTWGWRNDGAFQTAALIPASTASGIVAVLPVYDTGAAVGGYLPLYASFTA